MFHAHEMVELAGLAAQYGAVLIDGEPEAAEGSVEAYWAASKCRLDCWGRQLKRLSAGTSLRGKPRPAAVQARSLFEEILAGELLARVWTAVLCGYDRRRGGDRLEPLARSVFLGQMEIRHRLLSLLAGGQALDAETASRINATRSLIEDWADVLVGWLVRLGDVSPFAVDPDRAREFADDLDYQQRHEGSPLVWPLTMASLRATFRTRLFTISPNADLNARVASSILAFFPPGSFDGAGPFPSLWTVRLTEAAHEAERLLAHLLAEESSAARSR